MSTFLLDGSQAGNPCGHALHNPAHILTVSNTTMTKTQLRAFLRWFATTTKITPKEIRRGVNAVAVVFGGRCCSSSRAGTI